jgi:hypothetical protein
MGCFTGTRVKNATELKRVSPVAGNRTVMIHPKGKNDSSERFLAYCDITTDTDVGWHLVFTAFPRATSPYVNAAVNTSNRTPGGSVPLETDTSQHKFADDDIRTILNNGIKQTRTQWFHSSVEFPGTVWATGAISGTDRSAQYNEFEFPDNWQSGDRSAGQRFKRKWGPDGAWTGWITSTDGLGCSAAVGGWSNYYEQSCVQSWYAGCEGGPAINHKCAGSVQDRAEELRIWAA